MRLGESVARDVIGRAERADFSELNITAVPVKIDTGADYSSIWVSRADVDDKGFLNVVFFGKSSKFHDGVTHRYAPREYSVTRVANSFGVREIRYKIRLRITLRGRTIRSSFTLADRSSKLYPILIGRSLLKNKFVVDVSQGRPLVRAERKRAKEVKKELQTFKKGKLA